MEADRQATMRENVVELLVGGGAHLSFDQAVGGLAPELRGAKPEGQPHTVWRLVEHMRLAQNDIVEFTVDPDHASPPWPEGYWPVGDAPPNDAAWDSALDGFATDLQRLQDLVIDPGVDLPAPIPHGNGQTVLREAMLAADHNAYHIGQIVMIRRLLGAWR